MPFWGIAAVKWFEGMPSRIDSESLTRCRAQNKYRNMPFQGRVRAIAFQGGDGAYEVGRAGKVGRINSSPTDTE